MVSDECAHMIGEQRMEAHVLKSQLVVATSYLRLPIGPKGERRMSAANSVLPEVREMRSTP